MCEWIQLVIFRLVATIRLFHVLLEHADSELACIHRRRNLWYKMSKRPNMVKVPVREDDTANTVFAFFKIGNIRCYVIDAGISAPWKRKPISTISCVIVILDSHHVLADATISNNCTRGLWLDWQAQGTRVTGNLFHDNALPNDFEAG